MDIFILLITEKFLIKNMARQKTAHGAVQLQKVIQVLIFPILYGA